ncbi:hypothetical protein LLB_2772 [Legionella longbeachae D-4968]|nr:hypothetical protein LLB_2772 [Legionella longbeachae D-4968]
MGLKDNSLPKQRHKNNENSGILLIILHFFMPFFKKILYCPQINTNNIMNFIKFLKILKLYNENT